MKYTKQVVTFDGVIEVEKTTYELAYDAMLEHARAQRLFAAHQRRGSFTADCSHPTFKALAHTTEVADVVVAALIEEMREGTDRTRVKHSEQCIKDTLAYLLWQAQHPNHCTGKGCHGAGVIDISDSSVGLYGTEPCPSCVEQGKCPWCGKQTLNTVYDWDDDAKLSCRSCGWHTGAGVPQLECWCWEAQERSQPEPEPVEITMDMLTDEALARDDMAYDAWRENRMAGRGFRGRD